MGYLLTFSPMESAPEMELVVVDIVNAGWMGGMHMMVGERRKLEEGRNGENKK